MTFRATIGNKRGWEVYGSSCSIWCHDYQFYSNFSITANDDARRLYLQGVAIGITMAGLVFIFLPYSFICYSIMLRSKLQLTANMVNSIDAERSTKTIYTYSCVIYFLRSRNFLL
ncbi:hypothetical protein ES288_A10G232500v1 [Gossypium darwinii]|uniref:Uncharacterized protein n=1 Tax=Gossypium darwinii TaxID=34276 RepID=A0A5D2F1P4_GOSDA|nr:hypothetical protein ES288_A10G232500v1 [Gossypium darwinii]TYG99891.1 hypothetical protein ES288_A10G232500v1 [Gossypium darwinii]TYG99892.1 hypothetical protein ES288_A10G232500v1 [Gossypium darwinii]TYG99893.1 hypothetical protein ES288_A10G232500v1 [Gossypium darwinii]